MRRWAQSGWKWELILVKPQHFYQRVLPFVYSIEPSHSLYEKACQRFHGNEMVRLIHGTSEAALSGVLSEVVGDVCFWLDGHWSGGDTFKCDRACPVLTESSAIGNALPRLGKVLVFIDDMRLFGDDGAEGSGYPTRQALVEWAAPVGCTWHIEHDIVIAVKNGV